MGSSTTPRLGHLRPHGWVIYDTTVGLSTTPRSGHLRPHGWVIYDPTVGSSTTPRSGHLSFILSKFTPLLTFIGTIELCRVASILLREQLRTIVDDVIRQRQSSAKERCGYFTAGIPVVLVASVITALVIIIAVLVVRVLHIIRKDGTNAGRCICISDADISNTQARGIATTTCNLSPSHSDLLP